MNHYVLSLGSNLDNRETHLKTAIKKISEFSLIKNIAPVFENPPLLPEKAPSEWYQFFLNTAVLIQSSLSPDDLLTHIHRLELEAGRNKERQTWAPRPLDIDIVMMFSQTGEFLTHTSPDLTIPHSAWTKRNFVVSPLMHLLSHTPFAATLSLVQKNRSLQTPLCAFAAILNITPDSFSENNESKENHLQKMHRILSHQPAILDIGAESTRPGATPLTSEDEWNRLIPYLEVWKEIRGAHPFTQMSIDTRHALTAQRALNYGVDILNDVSGLSTPEMREVAEDYSKTILMHSLSIPADPNKVLPEGTQPAQEMVSWLEQQLSKLSPSLLRKLIFDPGIGFGKTPLQSLSLLQDIDKLKAFDLPLLIGHSRKSFMNLWSQELFSERDFETLGVSTQLMTQVEYLRIHNLQAHQRMQKSWLALEGAK